MGIRTVNNIRIVSRRNPVKVPLVVDGDSIIRDDFGDLAYIHNLASQIESENKKIGMDYFWKEIQKTTFEKIDSPSHQTSSAMIPCRSYTLNSIYTLYKKLDRMAKNHTAGIVRNKKGSFDVKISGATIAIEFFAPVNKYSPYSPTWERIEFHVLPDKENSCLDREISYSIHGRTLQGHIYCSNEMKNKKNKCLAAKVLGYYLLAEENFDELLKKTGITK